jgi:ABC-type Zn2+ transport system substrate-binding protein/surface adhesin
MAADKIIEEKPNQEEKKEDNDEKFKKAIDETDIKIFKR